MPRAVPRQVPILALAFLLAGCVSTPGGNGAPGVNGSGANTSTASGTMPTTNAGPWRALFDGTSTDAWRAYKGTDLGHGWRIEDGTLAKSGDASDLVTKDTFGDFELEWEWMLSPGGNSGVFYRGVEQGDYVYSTAPEYQLLDDAGHPDGQNRLTSAGSAYGLYAPPAGVVHPANTWNASRLVVRGAHVEHWLNGQKVVEYELWSPDWEARVKASKFATWPGFGRATRGYIGLQGDHPGDLRLRNIRVRDLR